MHILSIIVCKLSNLFSQFRFKVEEQAKYMERSQNLEIREARARGNSASLCGNPATTFLDVMMQITIIKMVSKMTKLTTEFEV